MTHIFQTIADKVGETPEEVYTAIQEAIAASDLPSLTPEELISLICYKLVGKGD